MAEADELQEDAPLSAEDVLTFGPCVEAVVWTPVWLQETRAPIAVAAGRPKFGPVFNSEGIGKAVVIRPCLSRGRLVRGLRPVYTPRMLESNAGVFDGWPMFTDHVPPQVQAALAKAGRSVRELAGQVLKGRWSRDFVHEDDHLYGYQKGAVLAEIWGAPLIRKTVDNNPNLLHTSINAWPTSGKPGPVPWRSGVKGMLIEGIRRQPQGSVDFVVRGGAGGRLLLEGVEDEPAWPELGEWSEEDAGLVVSIAEQLYASPAMESVTLPSNPSKMREWIQEHAPHLLPALAEATDNDADDRPGNRRGKSDKDKDDAVSESGLTEADVRRIIQESNAGAPTVEEFEQSLRESTERTLRERDEQRELSRVAERLIESAVGIPTRWKNDLKARYAMTPDGPTGTLLVEGEQTDEQGNTLTPAQVVEQRVAADLDHVRDLIAEATGKPRVRGEGGRREDRLETQRSGKRRAEVAHWRREFVSMGLAESAEAADEVFGLEKPKRGDD